MATRSDTPATVILDVDGTLVDTNYQHAIAWHRALREHGHRVQLWEIHRHIGMGGDQMVSALAGEEAEREAGEEIREAEASPYGELIGEVQAMDGAGELIADLHEAGSRVILASSARQSEVDHYLDLLEARELVDDWTSADDVDRTKPHPDLVEAALAKSGERGPAVMVGDSVWDVRAASAADVVPSIGELRRPAQCGRA